MDMNLLSIFVPSCRWSTFLCPRTHKTRTKNCQAVRQDTVAMCIELVCSVISINYLDPSNNPTKLFFNMVFRWGTCISEMNLQICYNFHNQSRNYWAYECFVWTYDSRSYLPAVHMHRLTGTTVRVGTLTLELSMSPILMGLVKTLDSPSWDFYPWFLNRVYIGSVSIQHHSVHTAIHHSQAPIHGLQGSPEK
jgi:hypothetical protein